MRTGQFISRTLFRLMGIPLEEAHQREQITQVRDVQQRIAAAVEDEIDLIAARCLLKLLARGLLCGYQVPRTTAYKVQVILAGLRRMRDDLVASGVDRQKVSRLYRLIVASPNLCGETDRLDCLLEKLCFESHLQLECKAEILIAAISVETFRAIIRLGAIQMNGATVGQNAYHMTGAMRLVVRRIGETEKKEGADHAHSQAQA